MYDIDICNADLNYCLLRAKPLCLTLDQRAQVNCLYALSLAKSNHIIIVGLFPTRSLIQLMLLLQVDLFTNLCYIYCSMDTIMCTNFDNIKYINKITIQY